MIRFIVFIILNFAALAIGGYFTGKGVPSDWYAGLNKAPWTPPGWVFGAAWTIIMLCFAYFMAATFKEVENHKLLIALFAIQWVLNVIWNPVFFHYHNVVLGLILITALTVLVIFMFIHYFPLIKTRALFIAPYIVWLLIASSLNAYILVKN